MGEDACFLLPLEFAAWSDDSSCRESEGLCSASVSTAASRKGWRCDEDNFRHVYRKNSICVAAQPSRWEDALARAEKVAEKYSMEKRLGQQQHERITKRKKEKQAGEHHLVD